MCVYVVPEWNFLKSKFPIFCKHTVLHILFNRKTFFHHQSSGEPGGSPEDFFFYLHMSHCSFVCCPLVTFTVCRLITDTLYTLDTRCHWAGMFHWSCLSSCEKGHLTGATSGDVSLLHQWVTVLLLFQSPDKKKRKDVHSYLEAACKSQVGFYKANRSAPLISKAVRGRL